MERLGQCLVRAYALTYPMNQNSLPRFAALAGLVVFTGFTLPVAYADTVVTIGSDPLGTEALLFTDPALPLSGALVQGSFAGTGAGYVLNFTSTSGNSLLQGVTVGTLAVEGLAGNDPLTALKFNLSQPTQTFTKALFNVDAFADGILSIAVSEGNGQSTLYQISADGSGNNFFTVEAINGQSISSITLSNVQIDRLIQIQVGGFAGAGGGGGGGTNVPDTGSTLAMFGLALSALAVFRRKA